MHARVSEGWKNLHETVNMVGNRAFCFLEKRSVKVLAGTSRYNATSLTGQLKLVCGLMWSHNNNKSKMGFCVSTDVYLNKYTKHEDQDVIFGYGDVGMLKYVHEQRNVELHPNAVNCGMRYKKFEMIEYLVTKGCMVDTKIMDWAMEQGSLMVVRACHTRGLQFSGDAGVVATRKGGLPLVQFVIEHGGVWSADIPTTATECGSLDVFQYALHNGCPWREEEVCTIATQKGRLDILQYAHESAGCGIPAYMTLVAAQCGRVEMLQYIHRNATTTGGDMCWDERVCAAAAKNGCLEVLQYAHENGCAWDERVCMSATERADLIMLRYAHENGCPWGPDVCVRAARDGNLGILKYAHTNGCPLSEDICKWATVTREYDILKYARQHNFPEEARCTKVEEEGAHVPQPDFISVSVANMWRDPI